MILAPAPRWRWNARARQQEPEGRKAQGFRIFFIKKCSKPKAWPCASRGQTARFATPLADRVNGGERSMFLDEVDFYGDSRKNQSISIDKNLDKEYDLSDNLDWHNI